MVLDMSLSKLKKNFFWDGGATSLESQVIGPITNPIEMHETMANVVDKLQKHPEYPSLFKKAFGTKDYNDYSIKPTVGEIDLIKILKK
jgi:cytochrome c peroxidase